uniref:Ribonuclease T2 n=2 Tax=Nothobranchius TaxID=28779 RepID=A0A1A8IMU5_NOTKU
MNLSSPLLFCLAAVFFSAASPHQIWNKLTLTHHWPTTFCSMEHCHAKISYWTLHGLWPDNGNECNSSWHFNSSQIEDLLPDMEKSWPDLIKPSSSSFWKYEWQKHGTCAAEAESLNSQHKYFSKALELYHKLDLSSALNKFNIIPSDYYKFSQIEGAIQSFYGVTPKIQCAHSSKNTQVQNLGQIEICFDSEFTLLDCEKNPNKEKFPKEVWNNLLVKTTSGFKVCDHDIPVYYPPLSLK